MSAAPSFTQTSPQVFESSSDPAIIRPSDLKAVIEAAKQAPNGRARILLHPSREDTLHEMLIALPPKSCDHPHINFKSGKSFLALSGRFAVMCFSDDGARINPVVLSSGPEAGAHMVRLSKPTWHTIIPLDGETVFLETIIGPFTGNRFADWFPAESQDKEREIFAGRLRTLARAAAEKLKEQ